MKSLNIKIALLLLIASGFSMNAQPTDGNPGDAPAPFGFTEVLLAAGAAFGGKTLYNRKKSNN